jgi:hypothetical protein
MSFNTQWKLFSPWQVAVIGHPVNEPATLQKCRFDREVRCRQFLERVHQRLSLELLKVLKAFGLVASPVE